MNKRSIVLILAVALVVAIVWFGGHALWSALVAMHHHPRH